MKRIVKIIFEPGEKTKLFDLLQQATTVSGAKLLVQEEMKVDAITANVAVDRFYELAKKKEPKS